MDKDIYRKILKRYWGYDDFRGVQREIIESICSGHDTLGLMPTGGGKSITFQVPALATPGLCIVITPLIALMRDQVQHLRERGIKATTVNSNMQRNEIIIALENCILGDYKFLYISPERLNSPLFQKKLLRMNVNLITVDEAHCISQWGYDFRPSYLEIAQIRTLVPNVPILALTASATPEVVDDIQKQLHFREPRVVRMSFERKNLTYIVRFNRSKSMELINLLKNISGSVIIYTRNRDETHALAELLVRRGFSATNYHAGLPRTLKDERQEGWNKNEYRIMVATNAFGLGIDKPDVRLVAHVDVPSSPEEYFQEAGRAGRDGKQAYAVLIVNNYDFTSLTRRISNTYPDPAFIRQIYEHVCYYYQMAMGDGRGVTREFDLEKFCTIFKHFPLKVHSALILLSNAGYIEYTEPDERESRLRFIVPRDTLYRLREQGQTCERVINALLRRYIGLFANFVNIDETRIARDTGLNVDEVYQSLKELAHIHVIDYVPYKNTNYITFLFRRVDTECITLRPFVYEDRKQQFTRRIKAMMKYITESNLCHTRFLLEYFGETNTCNCGKCDVCRQVTLSQSMEDKIRQSIIQQLSSSPLHPAQLDQTGFSNELFTRVIGKMMDEDEITLDEKQYFCLCRK